MSDETGEAAELRDELKRLRSRVAELEQTEERFRLAMETTNDALWDWNMRTDEVYRNPRHDTMLGYEPGELGASQEEWDKRIHPEDRPRVLGGLKGRLAGSRDSYQVEYRLKTKSGDYIWVLGRGNVVAYDDDGAPTRMIGTNIDITRRKEAEEEIRKFKTIAEKGGYGVGMIDLEGNLTYVNESFAQMHGYRPEELIGRHVSIFHDAGQMERVNQLNRQLIEQGSYIAEEVWHKRKDNTVFPTLMTATAIRDEKGGTLFLAATAIDITTQKRAEEELRYSEARFHLAMEATNDALWDWNMVTNEIYRNPRHASMLGYEQDEIPASEEGWEGLIHPDDKVRVVGSLEEYLAARAGAYEIEYRLKTKSGDYMWVLGRGKVVAYSDDDAPVRMIGTNIDITKHKKAEEALRESEERYRTLVESAGETIATVDANGVFTFMNTTAAKRLGGTPRDFVGKTMWDLFPKEIADRQVASIRRVLSTGQGVNVVVPTDLQGRLRWYNTTIELLRESAGEVTAALIVARDIHELMQAQEKVRTLSSAVEQSIDGIAMGDAKSQLFYVNEAFAHMHGYSRQEMIGIKAADLYAQDQKDRYEQIFTEVRKGGSYAGQAWHVRKDGTIFPCYLSVTLVKGDRAEVTGTVALCRDLTETRRKEEELSQYRAQMARAERLASLGTLSATVAHQITQPLTVIRLSLENALDELEGVSCPEKAIRRLQDSVIQVSNIADIINRFRNFARQSSDTRFGQVSVLVVAERVARLLEEAARQARVTLHLKGMGKVPPVIMNETDLEQVFFALLENAIQAADRTKARRVEISGAPVDKAVELRFIDNCGGMAPEIMDKVFDPFFTTKPRGYGTGLGLCIVHDIVSRVGGHVRLESKLGKGTTLFVTLPAAKERA